MGLPVWRAPSPEPRSRDALKADTTGQRSPIRRRHRSNRSTHSLNTSRGDMVLSALRSAHQQHWDPLTRRSSSRSRGPPPPVPELRNYSRSGDSVANAPTLHRDESSVRRSRTRLYGYLPQYDARASFGGEERPLPAFTLNFAPAAASRNSGPERESASRERSAARNRSPYRRVGSRSRSPWADRATSGSGDNVVITEDGDDSSDNAVGFPPLRRMGRRTIADGPLPSSSLRESWSPTTTLDGLGDRERSMSPFYESPFWDAFLGGTIVPDPVAPTADSSFTSAAASASFSNNSLPSSRAGSSNSNSASSSRTHLTVPSRRDSLPNDQFMRACDTSEDDTASDTEEEDFGSFRRRNRQDLPAEGPPSRNSQSYSRRVLERSRNASSYVRSFYQPSLPLPSLPYEDQRRSDRPASEQPDGPAEDLVTGDDDVQSLDQELRDARALLERLSRRDDVGDDFWASVGLTRPLADRVERIQQRERL